MSPARPAETRPIMAYKTNRIAAVARAHAGISWSFSILFFGRPLGPPIKASCFMSFCSISLRRCLRYSFMPPDWIDSFSTSISSLLPLSSEQRDLYAFSLKRPAIIFRSRDSILGSVSAILQSKSSIFMSFNLRSSVFSFWSIR